MTTAQLLSNNPDTQAIQCLASASALKTLTSVNISLANLMTKFATDMYRFFDAAAPGSAEKEQARGCIIAFVQIQRGLAQAAETSRAKHDRACDEFASL